MPNDYPLKCQQLATIPIYPQGDNVDHGNCSGEEVERKPRSSINKITLSVQVGSEGAHSAFNNSGGMLDNLGWLHEELVTLPVHFNSDILAPIDRKSVV